MITRIPAQTFPLEEFLRDELESRRWTQDELATVMGRPSQFINELLSGNQIITPEIAHDLGEAFVTGPDVWMNLVINR